MNHAAARKHSPAPSPAIVDADRLAALAESLGLPIAERATLPARAASFAPVPEALAAPVRDLLARRFPGGLYAHQAQGIATSVAGDDLCVATSTASGKSLIFMSAAAHRLVSEPGTRVLALYPARALIQDQIEKWRSFLAPLDLKVGLIDGSVAVNARAEILERSHVILMTPDVAHAWALSRAGEHPVRRFLDALRLVVLDEAHVYDGVFGTNMSYLMRRLDCVTHALDLIATTATLGQPGEFIERLTGRPVTTIAAGDDSSPAHSRALLLADGRGKNRFQRVAGLLKGIGQQDLGRFIAFGDSRRLVERMVVATRRPIDLNDSDAETDSDADIDAGQDGGPLLGSGEILPYRAGYEAEDRNAIQDSLANGGLAGVVSTSALELGLDIGDIDVVVLLNPPASAKAFWQRIGRTGRARAGVCIVVDDRGALVDRNGGLATWLEREVEPNWLYLDNRYIQYSNALCAAHEARSAGKEACDPDAFATLPDRFRAMVENEINPSEVIPDDLYPLKQRAQAGPHYEFPLRSGIEPSFRVKGPFGKSLGDLSYGQVLREAYPGAVYYYMARPYRVIHHLHHQREIVVRREKHLTTHPIAQTMVFPRFAGGMQSLRIGGDAFVTEADVQVSERVIGIKEVRGSKEEQHLYGPESGWSQRDLTRFFPTTGVCWFTPRKAFVAEKLGRALLEAYAAGFGVQVRDLGVGLFHANQSPLGEGKVQGMCVYDATHGSLRLTQRLAENFADVVEAARSVAAANGDTELAVELAAFAEEVATLSPGTARAASGMVEPAPESEWVQVVAAGGAAMLVDAGNPTEVTVVGHRYTPRGLLYELEPQQPGTKWRVVARDVQPIYGRSPMAQLNLETGEITPEAT